MSFRSVRAFTSVKLHTLIAISGFLAAILAPETATCAPQPLLPPMTAPSSSPSSRQALLKAALASCEQRFDSADNLITTNGASPGYHTRVKKGQLVHSTLISAQYAQLLLMSGSPEEVLRASRILERLLDLQVTDPTSIHYGIWGWFSEEPPEKMAPADWNWADFMGARFAEILHAHADALDPALVRRLQASLRHACNAIVKRDIGPHYTNICAMGAAVTLAAGELLDDPAFLTYGRRRLAAQRAALVANGGVPEYNSPHYGTVFILELERVLRLVSDPAARADAEAMRRRMWELTASQFHSGTGQWAGAQSRIYHDRLATDPALLIWQRTGLRPRGVKESTLTLNPDFFFPLPALACPPDLVSRFAADTSAPFEQEQTWMAPAGDKPAVLLRTWFAEDATLGSVNNATTWVQHRPVTAYWRDSEDGIASAKVELLKDGRAFASGRVRILQNGPRLLLVLGLATGQGDWHVSLDRPADGRFSAEDLRLRVVLSSSHLRRSPADAKGPWTLAAGDRRLVLHPGLLLFDGLPGSWETGTSSDNDEVYVDAILHQGPRRTFAPHELAETCVALGLELLSADQSAASSAPQSTTDGSLRRWRWDPVAGEIEAPVRLQP